MDRASGGSNSPHWFRNNIHDILRVKSVKIAVENGKSATRRRWERDCRELVRFGFRGGSRGGSREKSDQGSTKSSWAWLYGCGKYISELRTKKGQLVRLLLLTRNSIF